MSHDKWESFYENLLQEIRRCEVANQEMLASAECCFRNSTDLYVEMIDKAMQEGFANAAERVQFFKVKAKVGGKVELYKRLNHFILFAPPPDSTALLDFYQREMNRVSRFLEEHPAFCNYYQSGATHLDETYFGNLELRMDLAELLNDREPLNGFYDRKASRLMALMEYYRYIKNLGDN